MASPHIAKIAVRPIAFQFFSFKEFFAQLIRLLLRIFENIALPLTAPN